VRLKGGDPMISGRADEEVSACRAAGIAVEIIPGITAAQVADSRLAESMTRQGCADQDEVQPVLSVEPGV
jgi:uroporphyrin-III C-methyltransferase/precorrin-2 dehydrogenase/sirohydrochlorin ferrochelatase